MTSTKNWLIKCMRKTSNLRTFFSPLTVRVWSIILAKRSSNTLLTNGNRCIKFTRILKFSKTSSPRIYSLVEVLQLNLQLLWLYCVSNRIVSRGYSASTRRRIILEICTWSRSTVLENGHLFLSTIKFL